MKNIFTASISKEGKWWVAQCLDNGVASQGRTKPGAINNLKEAIKLHYAEPTTSVSYELWKINLRTNEASMIRIDPKHQKVKPTTIN